MIGVPCIRQHMRCARLSVVDGTVVGSAKGCIPGEVVMGVNNLKGECREEEEGTSFARGEDAAAGLKAMRANEEEQ